MKNFTLAIIALIINASAIAQAEIKFENTTVSYDDIKVGSDGQRSFVFKNTGTETLIIEKVVSTGKHIKVIESRKRIESGSSDQIKIIYDTKVPGPIRRTITLYSNAANQPVAALKVKGNVVKEKP
ncbi:MAG TPA: DUF1573 domain-containing protein [Flavobacteriaceae bacterium]|nr:DUF1573 domain-containing protein [Flavobacteriaceae bacterium]